MIADRETRPAKDSYPFCNVCKRKTYHLLGNCCSHSEWHPPSSSQATVQDLELLAALKRQKERKHAANLEEKEEQAVQARLLKWQTSHTARKGKVYRKYIPLPIGNILCDRCWHPMEMVKATYGLLSTGLSARTKVESENYLTADGKVLTVETLKRMKFPSFTRICACPTCVTELLDYVVLEQRTWQAEGGKGEFKPSFSPEMQVTNEGRMPPGFGLDAPPSNRRSGRWKTWTKM